MTEQHLPSRRAILATSLTADNPSFGPDVPDSALGIYFELAALDKGETATRKILLFDDNEKQVEEMSTTLDCTQ